MNLSQYAFIPFSIFEYRTSMKSGSCSSAKPKILILMSMYVIIASILCRDNN